MPEMSVAQRPGLDRLEFGATQGLRVLIIRELQYVLARRTYRRTRDKLPCSVRESEQTDGRSSNAWIRVRNLGVGNNGTTWRSG